MVCCDRNSQFRLLLWKNWVLKKRRATSTLSECLIPIIAFIVLVILRQVVTLKEQEQIIQPYDAGLIEYGSPAMLYTTMCGTVLQLDRINAEYNGDVTTVKRFANQSIGIAPDDGSSPDVYQQSLLLQSWLQQQLLTKSIIVPPCCNNVTQWDMNNCSRPTGNVTHYIEHGLFHHFSSSSAMQDYTSQSGYGQDPSIQTLTLGVILSQVENGNWDYTLRMNYSDVPFTGENVDKYHATFDLSRWGKYALSSVTTLQTLIDSFIVQSNTAIGNDTHPLLGDIKIAPFPVAKNESDMFGTYMELLIGLFLVCCFLWPFSRLVRNMVEEKEKRIRESMKMMGLSNSNFWLSWAFTYVIMFFIMCIIATGITRPTVFKHSNMFLIFLFFFSFCLSLISLAALLTTFFSRAKTAGTLSPFMLLLCYLPYISVNDAEKDTNTKNLACLLSPVALSLGSVNILQYESGFVGLTTSNINEIYQNFSVGTAIGMMFFDFLLYGLLAWYLDMVWPSEFGTRYKWYFPVQPSFWKSLCCSKKNSSLDSQPLLNPSEDDLSLFGPEYEPVSHDLLQNVGIRIRSLRKTFTPTGNGICGQNSAEPFVAVEGLDLNMYTGQIFVLLGHNGAGKTTTINCLTGMLPPTSGHATIYDHDIEHEMSTIRTMIGVCPQHNTLFDDLTVREHLEFYATLKRVPINQRAAAVHDAIMEVKLAAKSEVRSSALSGGQKRRLSLAISLIGDSKVIFLDEPTSGVDPFSRRAIWDVLNKKKEGRVIILTTHFMDEADQLGDRIGIMHHGRMKCCGSSLFLKRQFGVGYNLVVTRNSGTRSDDLPRLIHTHIPSADRISDVGNEISYRLPLSASPHFPTLFGTMDEQKERLGIANYALSVTTLEEVFIKVANDGAPIDEKQVEEQKEVMKQASSRQLTMEALEADPSHTSFTRHFSALLTKRWHITKRDKRAACCQFLVPLILLIFGLGLLRIPPNFDFPNLKLTTDVYNKPNRVPINTGLFTGLTSNIHNDEALLVPYETQNFTTFQYDILNASSQSTEILYGAYYHELHETQSNHTIAPGYHYTVLTNITADHGLPTFINLGNTALLRNVTGKQDAKITTHIHPFSFTEKQKEFIQDLNGVFSAIVIALAFSFIPASFAVFIVLEREQNSKHLQMISGVGIWSYWLSSYLWDLISYIIPALIGSGIVYIYDNPNFVGDNFSTIVACFMLYGLAVIPFTYCCSFFFRSHSTAQNVMIIIYLLGGIIMTMVSFALHNIDSTKDANDNYVRFFFRLLPSFCLGDAIFWMSARTMVKKSRWELDVVGYDCIFMIVEAIVYFIATIMIEYAMSNPNFVAFFKRDPPMNDPIDAIDEDVATEISRIQSGGANNDLICLEGLTKVYPGKVAVKDLWFAIPAGQCFGFLGVNGAGKTTTLKMLTGDAIPSSGQAFLAGYDIATQPQSVRRLMGYCPQFDALHENLTAEETLQFYGRIRGIPEEKLSTMVNYLIDRLSLREYAQRKAGTYSGGNKRKLSVAIALIGNPPVVFLDEPSTGMDPVSRRFMWDFISETMATRAVILTTHSMEECEALCSRIGMIVSGSLKCIGSSQHLKTRFGKGLQIDISTGGASLMAARNFMLSQFPTIQEIECYGNNLKYRLPNDSSHWTLTQLFTLIEQNKNAVNIAEYSIGQTTLESIFIMFAKQGDDQPDLAEVEEDEPRSPIERAQPPQQRAYAQLQGQP